MRCMEEYGAYSNENDTGNSPAYRTYGRGNARQYYVMDKNTKQVYIGLNGVNDGHVSMYKNTDTILFRVIVVETKAHSPDPLLFPDSQISR